MSEFVFQVGDKVLEQVVHNLNYSSVDAFNRDVNSIREWMRKQPHFPELMSDRKIENFLLLSKGRVESAKTKISNYYCMRDEVPEIFSKSNSSLVQMVKNLRLCYCVPLPKLTENLHRIHVLKMRQTKIPKDFDVYSLVRYLVNLQEIRMAEDVTYGDVYVFDGKDVPFELIVRLTPQVIYKTLVLIYKKVFSMRLNAVYIINAPSFIEKLLMILRVILKPKLLERIHICSFDFMKDQLGVDVLPKDYGGKEKYLCELEESVIARLYEYEGRFQEFDSLRLKQELRSELKNDEILGFHGSFRKLDID